MIRGLFVGTLLLGTGAATAAEKVSFAKDILPILSANCFTCHGPDSPARKGGLRLDQREDAVKTLKSGLAAIVPNDLKASESLNRILSNDPDEKMPPAESGKSLTAKEIELLKRWIDEGAVYEKHWSFQVPQRQALPPVATPDWIRNGIDRFVLARLEAEKLAPAPEADRHILARRAAIDLTGLPPDREWVAEFVNDLSPLAFEKYIDRLLASKAYGERWAALWLDLARYADSNGFADDRPRIIWRYRDWVVEAINDNLPFDRFTVDQLAGDLLPSPTESQILATGFHRNTLTNDEGGTSDEEFRVAAVVDRVNTTTQVWMGLTMSCAQCHNHKYDPLTQEEYYRLFAVFNQTADNDQGDNAPLYTIATPEQLERKARLDAEVKRLEAELKKKFVSVEAEQAKWEKSVDRTELPKSVLAALEVEAAKRTGPQKNELKQHFLSKTPALNELVTRVADAKKEVSDLQAMLVTSPVMKELPKAQQRKTHILVRGNFLEKDREVTPGVPAVFAPLPTTSEANRLGLANWLVDSRNPLTARVAVNRYWEQLFGRGLVETPEDWGLRGKLPSHPELLDYLATEFVSLDWDVKRLLKLMVTSATYRQSSRVTKEQLERDPDNQFYARGPRFRASAEVIRDQALQIGGLLSPKMYGKPVRPPRPKLGLSAAFGGSTDWDTSPGEDRYRRGLYTEWRRTTPYPSMTTFDATSRNVCTVSRPRTNTPLQALVTLNDPVFVESAQALARRMLKEGGETPESKLRFAFVVAISRPPAEGETKRLVKLFQETRERLKDKPAEATALATEPAGPLPKEIQPVDAAAWTVVANVILNLDEIFSKR
jgi:hypothetical protein